MQFFSLFSTLPLFSSSLILSCSCCRSSVRFWSSLRTSSSLSFRAFALAASAPLLASLAQGQVNAPPAATRGMLMTVPSGFLAVDASGQQDLRVSLPGSRAQSSLTWSPTTFVTGSEDNPDYSPAAVALGLQASGVIFVGGATSTLELSGVSTGNAMFPYAGPDGVITAGTGSMGWWACSVTVGGTDAPSFGEPSNATWSSLTEPKKSVVTYYPGTNTGLSSSFVDALHVENLPHEWGIDGAAFSDVLGLDLGIGVVSFDPTNSRSAPFVSDRSQLFFSLSPGSAEEWFASSAPAHAVTNASGPAGAALLHEKTRQVTKKPLALAPAPAHAAVAR